MLNDLMGFGVVMVLGGGFGTGDLKPSEGYHVQTSRLAA